MLWNGGSRSPTNMQQKHNWLTAKTAKTQLLNKCSFILLFFKSLSLQHKHQCFIRVQLKLFSTSMVFLFFFILSNSNMAPENERLAVESRRHHLFSWFDIESAAVRPKRHQFYFIWSYHLSFFNMIFPCNRNLGSLTTSSQSPSWEPLLYSNTSD